MKKILILILFPTFLSFSQDLKLSALLIPKELSENANSVVRDKKIEITILSQKSMIIKTNKTLTVLNSKGLNNIDAIEYYDNSTKIKSIEATVYNSFGKEIKKIKRKDFKDQSVADGFSVYSDNRVLFLDYTPIGYPFTIVYSSEIETLNTAFIPTWFPIGNYYESVQSSEISVKYIPELGFKYKERNFKEGVIQKNENDSQITYAVQNLSAQKDEELSPNFLEKQPSVLFGLDNFFLEGVAGKAKTWKEFGNWVYNELLSSTETIPEATVQKVKSLVGDEKDPIKKAKIIYDFLQERSRYVSVQLGIGGWKPMLAIDVDRLGYGDCKALTNYTRVLLKHVGVESYYTILYAGNHKRDVLEDFVSLQGNHAILSIPKEDGYIYLECTSQVSPFGFNGSFTDDRLALVIKPNGSEIVKTTILTDKENFKKITGQCIINESGSLSGKIKVISNGLQYDREFVKERLSREDQIKLYNNDFSSINNLKITKIKLNNDKDKIEFTEEIEFEADNYAQNSNGKLIFALNTINQNNYVPKKYRNREYPFEIPKGFTDEDSIEIILPRGYEIEAFPNGIEINSEFGFYKIEFINVDSTKIICKRMYVLRKGLYDTDKYESYRKFKETVAKNDNSKIILTKL